MNESRVSSKENLRELRRKVSLWLLWNHANMRFVEETDSEGNFPIVVAFGYEPISELLRRHNMAGGRSNVFILEQSGTLFSFPLANRLKSSVPETRKDLSDPTKWHIDAPIENLTAYMRMHPEGMLLPLSLPGLPKVNSGESHSFAGEKDFSSMSTQELATV